VTSSAIARLFVLIAFAIFCSPAMADAEIHKGDPDGWIERVELPKPDPRFDNQIRNGISNILSEYEIRQRPGGSETFDRYAYKIVDRTGLERGAAINFEFDPATSQVTMNWLNIIRDGVVINRLPEATFDVFRREKDAEKGLFDGWLTAYVNVDDVRVGDIIDYGRTTIRTPIVGGDLFFHSVAVAWGEPVALIREKVTWPTDRPLNIRRIRTDIQPDIKTDGAMTTYLWQSANPVPVKSEENLPADFPAYPTIQMSSTSRWQDVVDAVSPYYRLDQQLPAGFASKLDDIAARYARPEDRMIEAMRLVQDTIRYVSLSMGRGSYIPRSPDVVVKSGFGDCKDKALLLAISLRRLGVQADPALTDLDGGFALGDLPPTIRAFDHVIVKAVIKSETYWIDATNYLQGGRAENLVPPDYGFALPIVAGKAEMERIGRKELFQPTTFVSEAFDFPTLKGEALRLTVSTTYRDADADSMRYRLVSQSATKLADDYLQYYNRQYPGMTSLAPLSTNDDRDRNVVTTVESYELPAEALDADDLVKNFPLKADLGIGNLPEPDMVGRVGPIWLGSPVFKRHQCIVRNLKAEFVGPEKSNDVITPYVAFKARWSSKPTEFQVDWFLKTIGDRVPAKDIGSYLKSRRKMTDNASWSYNFAYADAEAN
jgi:transglutaminase-like putative cysteine protease